ncbi:TRAP transporter small permease [Nitratireductor sp. ZSWI3]|uniref:TRAP transporter small permease n=1 Tax=Nitratireductor sp. ZSWI3 TaxID=2966359 RepID=UPI00214F8394|nr:TRAP transporter small permease [Nitratireductor sp. ZSWI3]MCR4267213.1 TRAP transporter small permease [Nitratireductor sp. ZSWI3]
MLNQLERLGAVLATVSSWAARIMLSAVAVILFLQVTLRYGFGFSLPWPEEAARYLMIWVVMLAGSLLVRDEQLVRVDFFDQYWPKRVLSLRNASFRLLLAVLLAVLLWKGYENADFGQRRSAATLPVSFYWIYLSVPVGAGLMMFHMLVLAIRDLVRGTPETGPSVLKAEI